MALSAAAHEPSAIADSVLRTHRAGPSRRSTDAREAAIVRVMLWDVRVGGERRLPLLERVDADVLLLLGVSRKSGRSWTERWTGRYHCATGLQLATSPQKQPHGAMIASRWPLQQAEPITELARPERGLIATTDLDGRPLTLISWGTPNAAGEGYPTKMAAYRHMTSLLVAVGHATILGLDTTSRYDPPDPGVPEQPDEIRAEEHAFLRRDAAHRLRDVHRSLIDRDRPGQRLLADLRPDGPLATTFIRRPYGSPRGIARGFAAGRDVGLDRMEGLFVSSELEPLACEHLYHEALDSGGDHAAVIADLELRPGTAPTAR